MKNIIKRSVFLISEIAYFVFYYFRKLEFDTFVAKHTFYDFTLAYSYFNALVGFFLITSLFDIFQKIIQKLGKKILFFFNTKKLEASLGRFLLKFTWLLKFCIGIYAFIFFIKKDKFITPITNKIQLILVVVVICYFLAGFIRLVFEKQFKISNKSRSPSSSVIKFVNQVLVVVIWISGIGYIIASFWYNLSALLAWAGIGWLAIALAAQKSLTNIFWAITIILNKPFYIGDYVNINGKEWVVKDIGLSYLTIIDRLWHRVMIPNETIITSSIANFSVRENRRVEFSIGLVYSTTLEKVKEWIKIIESILKKRQKLWIISDDIRVNFDVFWKSSLDVMVTYFSLTNDLVEHLKEKELINLEIKEAFTKASIDMAFPTQELIVKSGVFPWEIKK